MQPSEITQINFLAMIAFSLFVIIFLLMYVIFLKPTKKELKGKKQSRDLSQR